jgi:hypothetical protein
MSGVASRVAPALRYPKDTPCHLSSALTRGVGHVRSIWLLCGHRDSAVEKLRRKIGSVWPNHCVKLWMYAESLKDFDVPQWLEYRPIEFVFQINIAFRSVAKPEVKDMLPKPFGPCYSNHTYSKGGMC